MKKRFFLTMLCMLLVVSIPFVYAQPFATSTSDHDLGSQNAPAPSSAQSYSSSSESLDAGYLEGEVGFFEQPTSLLDRIGAGFSTTFGNPQDVGEALVVNVAGMEPSFVRASLLEQQEVPIFVSLRGSDIGSLFEFDRDPLTGLSSLPPIRSIVVRLNKTNPHVKYVKYIPPKRDAYSKKNLGVLVIILNRLKNETALPSASAPETQVFNATLPKDIVSERLIGETPVISLDLTAEILFDLSSGGLLGLGEESLSLKSESEQQFLEKPVKEENGFFADRAYVRVEDVSSDRVTIEVYNKQLLPLAIFHPARTGGAGGSVRTLTLRKRENSAPVRLGISNNPLEDTVLFRLDDVLVPGDKASYRIIANGKSFDRKANVGSSIFPGSNYQIKKVTVSDPPQKINFAEITKDFNFDQHTLERMRELDPNSFEKVTYTMTLKNLVTREVRDIERKVVTSSGASLELVPVDAQTADFLESKYCSFTPNLEQDPACESVQKFKKLIKDFPASDQALLGNVELAEIYLDRLIDVEACDLVNEEQVVDHAVCKQFEADMNALALFYADKIEKTHPEVLERIREGFGGVGGFEFLQTEGVSIQLKTIERVTEREKGSALIRIGNDEKPVDLSVDGRTIIEGFNVKGEKFTWVLTRIRPNSITVGRLLRRSSGKDIIVNEKSLSLGRHSLVVKDAKRGEQPETVTIEVKSVTSNNEALITVIPGAGQGISHSSFQVHIPVEPRPFKFTPEQLTDQINATRALIEDLDNVINKLDAVVRAWKKVCLVTFAFVTLKSSFLGGTARTLARRSVANIYKEQCSADTLAGKYSSVDECLAARGSEIAKDVDANERAIESVNRELAGKTPNTLEDCGGVPFQEVQALGASIEDCREHLRLTALNDDPSISDTFKNTLEPNLNELQFEKKKAQLDAANDWFDNQLTDAQRKALLEAHGGEEEGRLEALRQRVQAVEDAQRLAKEKKTVLPLRALTFDKDDQNKAQAIIPQVDPKTNQIIPGQDFKNLVKVSELQKKVYDFGAQKVYDDLKVECKRKEACIVTTLIRWNKAPDHAELYVEPSFVKPADSVAGVPEDLHKYNLLIHDQKIITESALPPEQIRFKMYASQVTQVANRPTSLDYAYTQELIAEYDPETGYAFCYPTGEKGEYILVLDRFKQGSVKDLRVMNVGLNGVIECTGGGDDVPVLTESALNIPANVQTKNKYLRIIQQAPRCSKDGANAGSVVVRGRRVPVKCSLQQSQLNLDLNGPKCIDVMEPQDCTLLFNACDPVMCPASRCNLGGRYRVDDVIQSGIVGSTILCMPNAKQGVVVPVCLTGILAGLKNVKSILQGYADCLELSLKEGQNVGFCDYIRSVGICELVWREVINIFNVKGPVIDYLSESAFGEPEGGAEYLTFQQSVQNVGDSFNYFTSEYSNTYVAALKGQSTDEIGTQVCRLGVYGKLPSVGEVLDKLSEPEDPPQFTAFFDDAPYVSDIDVSQTSGLVPGVASQRAKQLSNYKVFYHIYAGTGFAQTQQVFGEPLNPGTNRLKGDVTYSVFLVNKELGLPPLYVTTEDENQVTAVIPRNQYAQKTVQQVAIAGYNEICVNLNGKEECGFGKVTSAFSLNYLNDRLVDAEAREEITSAEECVPNAPDTGAALGSLTTPENYGVFNTGIVRICNPTPPTADFGRWQDVGMCGDQGTCWLDKNSINIKDAEAETLLLKEFKERNRLPGKEDLQILSAKESKAQLTNLNNERDSIIERLRRLVL